MWRCLKRASGGQQDKQVAQRKGKLTQIMRCFRQPCLIRDGGRALAKERRRFTPAILLRALRCPSRLISQRVMRSHMCSRALMAGEAGLTVVALVLQPLARRLCWLRQKRTNG